MLFFLLIVVTIIIISFIFPRSHFLSFLLFVTMWLLWGYNTLNGDYDNYERFFENSYLNELTIYEPCYLLLNKFILKLGLSFSDYMLVYSFIVLALVYYFASTSKYPAIFSSLYYLNFIMEYVFMRNYLANALLFVFIVFCMQNTRHNNAKALLLLILASLFHVTSLMYIMFFAVLMRKLSDKSLFLIPFVALILAGFIFNVVSLDPGKLGEKVSVYTDSATPTGPIIMHITLVAISLFCFKLVPPNTFRNASYKDMRMASILKRFNIISLAYIPAYMYIPYMTRFFRVLFPVNIYIGLLLFYYAKTPSKKIYCTIYIILGFTLMLYRFSTSSIEDTFIALFINNKILPL